MHTSKGLFWTAILALGFFVCPLPVQAVYNSLQRSGSHYRKYQPNLGSPHTPQRFGYIQPKQTLPTRPTQKKCVPHGLARCVGHPKKERFYNRYLPPSKEDKSVHPRLRARYQNVRNF